MINDINGYSNSHKINNKIRVKYSDMVKFLNYKGYYQYRQSNSTHIVLSGDSKAMLAERVIQDYKMFIRNKWDSKRVTLNSSKCNLSIFIFLFFFLYILIRLIEYYLFLLSDNRNSQAFTDDDHF